MTRVMQASGCDDVEIGRRKGEEVEEWSLRHWRETRKGRTGQDSLESVLDIRRVKSRRLDAVRLQQVISFVRRDSKGKMKIRLLNSQAQPVVLREQLGLLCRYRPKVPQIALVADEHDDDVRVGVVAQLLQPAEDVDVGRVLGDVVDEKSSDGAAVVTADAVLVSARSEEDGQGSGKASGETDAEVMARYRSCPAVVGKRSVNRVPGCSEFAKLRHFDEGRKKRKRTRVPDLRLDRLLLH